MNTTPLSNHTSPLSQIVSPLMNWYDQHSRILPWRSEPTPYYVWVSEIMLQQTRVDTALPYFERFIREIPTIQQLAHTDDQTLLKLWEGLGYYNRVRNLKKAAQMVMRDYGGTLPSCLKLLKTLPGIGDYTAAAIASIAFGLQAAAVDGNVLRVITRILEDDRDIQQNSFKKTVAEWIEPIIPTHRAGDFTQALMELGAIVCLPNGTPQCDQCPLAIHCRAYQAGTTLLFPKKTAKKPRRIEQQTVLIVIANHQQIALQQRPPQGLLAGLWELPNQAGVFSQQQLTTWIDQWVLGKYCIQTLKPAKHIFTHVEWHMHYHAVFVSAPNSPFIWVNRLELEQHYPLPGAFKQYYPLMLKWLT